MATSLCNLQVTTAARHAPARPLVLIADDDADTRLLFRTVLEIRRFCVIEAADGEETVRAAESARPDLILMDGSLPRQSGLDAARTTLDADLGWALGVVFRSYIRGVEAVVNDLPGGPRGYQVLAAAAQDLADNQAELATHLGIDRPPVLLHPPCAGVPARTPGCA